MSRASRQRVVDPDLLPDLRRPKLRGRQARVAANARAEEIHQRLQQSVHLLPMIDGERLARSLHEYTRRAWETIEPTTRFVDNWHIGVICEHLEALLRSEIKCLVVNVPPGTMKSLLTNVMASSWAWTRWPEKRMAFVAGSDGLETRDSLKCRRVIESPWYQARWGHTYQLTGDQNAKTRYENDRTGVRMAQTYMSAVMGERFDHWFFDDPHKTEMMESADVRLSKITKFKEEYSTRKSDIKTGTVCVIMQRIAEDDLSGYLLSEGLADAHICIPMRYERPGNDRRIFLPPRFKDPRTREGQLLDPIRFPEKELKELERTLGSYGTAGQMQQLPSPRGGGIFQRAHWKFYKSLPELDEVIGSWDLKFKQVATSSWVAGQTWGRKGANKYLLPGRVREHLGFGASCLAIRTQKAAHPLMTAILVEDKANGPAVIETLTAEIPGIIPVEPRGGKEARAYAIQPQQEAGNLWLPDPSIDPTIEGFIHRCGVFPAGESDEVDAMTQAITYLALREGFGLWSYLKEQQEALDRQRAEQAKKDQTIHIGGPPAQGMLDYMRSGAHGSS